MLVEKKLLVQSCPNSLYDAAPNLSLHYERIDHCTAVLDHCEIEQLNESSTRIDSDHGAMRRIGERALIAARCVGHGDIEQRIDACRKRLHAQMGDSCNLLEANAAARADNLTGFKSHAGDVGLQDMGADPERLVA